MVVCSFREEKVKNQEVTINLSSIIRETLLQLGVSSRLSGFLYLQEGIYMTISDFELTQRGIVCGLYPEIAKTISRSYGGNKYPGLKISPVSVERCIRTAIQSSWARKRPMHEHIIGKIFGEERLSIPKGPSNKEYICAVALYIMNKYEI